MIFVYQMRNVRKIKFIETCVDIQIVDGDTLLNFVVCLNNFMFIK